MKFRTILATAVAILSMATYAAGDIFLPSIFSDHMVLQRNAEVTIWGQAKPYETVTIANTWNGEKPSILVTREGWWSLKLHTPDAGGPYTITVQGYNTIVIHDVLIGEIWLASGQSNMEFTSQWVHNFAKDIRAGKMKKTFDPDKAEADVDAEIKAADHPQIRFFNVAQIQGKYPQNDVRGHWEVCTPETMKNFSLVAYYFGRRLNAELEMPVGLINDTWGGTPCDVWTPADAMLADPALAAFAKTRDKETWGPNAPGLLFNGMVNPIIPYRIAGMIWNQGEENVGENRGDYLYARLFSTMVKSWREKWGYDFPVFYVQIPPYRYDEKDPTAFRAAILRDQQRRALALIPNSGMVVMSDLAEVDNIHPVNKLPVGERLAMWALNRVYHVTDEIPCGPLYKSMKVEGDAIRVSFENDLTLKSLDGKPLNSFEVAGADGVYHPAEAEIDGDDIVVKSPDVKKPVNVRFAWTNIAVPNLASCGDLPASPFTSETPAEK
jgi:sialate O-acetylesterase